MNIEKLYEAEINFLSVYPGGFSDPAMEDIKKKHKPEKMKQKAQEFFAEENFKNIEEMTVNIAKIITTSSMVSVFEKPKFRDFTKAISKDEKKILVAAYYDMIHGDQERGFDSLVDFLRPYKLAKWTLVTAAQFYYRPEKEVFVKPTTCKGVIEHFELEGLIYKPLPDFAFYKKYRTAINKMKRETKELKIKDNAAFSGFLMMTLPKG